jgi:hypothetical protein
MVDRWEYLVTYPYTVRHQIAEHFVQDYDTVIDVGVYKHKIDGAICIDPLGTVDGFYGTASQWLAVNTLPNRYAVILLGCAIEGDQQEWEAVRQIVSSSSLVVLEWATDYVSPFGDPSLLMVGFNTIFHAQYVLPDVDTPGFPVYNKRIMIVGKK